MESQHSLGSHPISLSTFMRIAGTGLMVVGSFVMLWATISLFGMNVRVNGTEMIPTVASVPGAFVGGIILIIGGAWLRRRAQRRSAPESAV
jgi:hypothetical protein